MSFKKKTKRRQKSNASYSKQTKKPSLPEQKITNAFKSAVEYHQAGQVQVAEQLYRQVLTGNPEFADAHGNLGVALQAQGRLEEAEACSRQAIRLKPDYAEAHMNLGNIFLAQGLLAEAVESYEKTIAINPNYAEAYSNLSIALERQGRFDEAAICCQKAIKIKPDFAVAYNNLGNVFKAQGNFESAASSYRKSISLLPDYAEAFSNLGNVLQKQGYNAESVANCRRAIAINPNFAEAYSNLGIALHNQGLFSEAIANYRRAIALKQDLPEAHSNLGNAFQEQGLLEQAITSCRNAIAIKSDYAEGYNNLGVALQEKGLLEEATACYKKAIIIKPDYAEAHNNLGVAFQDQGKLGTATLSFQKAMNLKPDYALANSSLLTNFNYCPNTSRKEIHKESLAWDRKYAKALLRKEPVYSNTKDKNRKLRIGYVSPDFKAHSVAYFFEPLLKARNKEKTEVFCYSNVMIPDPVTERLRKKADRWCSIVGKRDGDVAEEIRRDEIDILVDLAGHTKGNRLLVFGYKPAPIQITYLGFPNTTGLSAIDYRITDEWADPMGKTDAFYSEKLIRMPRTFLCYDPPKNLPPIQKESLMKNGAITFGSFNNRVKINTGVIKVWAEILSRVPKSKIILKAKQLTDSGVKEHLLDLFSNYGVAADRVIFIEWAASTFDHFNLYNRVDIALDTFPYNGTTTTCEAIWMGTPVIALAGDRHASRVGVSLLSTVGIPELIAESIEDYIEKAVALTNDRSRLQQLQKNLRGMMAASPLMGATEFAIDLEATYRQMWHSWCDGSEMCGGLSTLPKQSMGWGIGNSYKIKRKGTSRAVSEIMTTALKKHKAGELEDAEQLYQRVLVEDPDNAEANHLSGLIAAHFGQNKTAIKLLQKAIESKPDYAEVHYNLGVIFQKIGQLQLAEYSYKKAVAFDPTYSKAYCNLGAVLQNQMCLNEGAANYRKAISVKPDNAEAHNNLAMLFQEKGELSEAVDCFQKALTFKPDYPSAHSNLLFHLNYMPNISAKDIFNESEKWEQQQAQKIVEAKQVYTNVKEKDRRLRIGYVSPDFRTHSVSYFFAPLLTARNREKFEVFCYSNVEEPDDTTDRMEKESDTWRSIVGMSDKDVVSQIRRDEIDILIDLAGHTRGNRLLVFAYKPAPVQISYLGYPNTTGLSTIDYRITDALADLVGKADELHTEKLIRMSRSFLCYIPPEGTPPVQKKNSNSEITFGSFNNRPKISSDVIRLWADVLNRVPNSSLVLKAKQLSDSGVQEDLLKIFATNGIDSDRIKFYGWVESSFNHFELYNQIDIALDTFPYNGTTTTCEALWMGTPVVTLSGASHAGRVGVSLLTNVGLGDLIAESEEDYIEKAVALAKDTARLKHFYENLRGMMAASPLMDAIGFTRELEAIYRRMWHSWCDGTEMIEETVSQEPEPNRLPEIKTGTDLQDGGDTKAAVFANKEGEALFELGNLEGARKAFINAIEKDPAYVVAYNNLGVLHWQQGDSGKAVEFLMKALNIDPLNQDANFNLEEIFKSIGQDKKTIAPVTEDKPVIRILHNMARSGGTLISKCLGCMADVALLSEIHPFGSKWFNPLNQAHEWFNLLTADDMAQIKAAGEIPFNGAIDLIHKRAAQQDKALIIRDWSHLDFTAVPFVEKPTYRLTTAELLGESFEVKHTTTVRHPIDQWLSLRNLGVMKGKIFLEDFLRGYLKFAEFCREIGYVRYEDFTRSPEKAMKTLCESLDVPYDPSFMENWWKYTKITGDTNSSRGAKKEIKQTPRREIEPGLLSQFQNNPDYIKAIELLGYEHPEEAKKITPVNRPKNEDTNENDRINKVYDEFIETNKKFWAAFSPSPSELDDKVILVDCLVDFPPYILGNLIIAKYFQKRNNATIVGVVRDQSQLERNCHLLSSFAVEKVIYACGQNNQQYNLDIEDILVEKDVKKLREKVLNFSIDGITVGDLVYDAYLRDTGEPTIHGANDVLINYFYEAKRYYDVYDIFCKHNNVVATVQGHTVYLMYGMMARVAAKHGATVFGRKPGTSPMTIRRYDSLGELYFHERGFEKDHFNFIFNTYKNDILEKAKSLIRQRFRGISTKGTDAHVSDGFRAEKKIYSKAEFFLLYELDTKNPTAFIMCHAFSDSPHVGGKMIHSDYFEWLEDTLEILADIPDVNWVVKLHPQEDHYPKLKQFIINHLSKYLARYSHIHLAPENIHTSCIQNIADAIVTVRGSAALEFSALGIPSIVTGDKGFLDYGFTYEAKNRNEYITLLTNLKDLGKLSREKTEKALAAFYMYFDTNLVDCIYIPNVSHAWWEKLDLHKFWVQTKEALQKCSPGEDPLYHNFNFMVENDQTYLMKYNTFSLTGHILKN